MDIWSCKDPKRHGVRRFSPKVVVHMMLAFIKNRKPLQKMKDVQKVEEIINMIVDVIAELGFGKHDSGCDSRVGLWEVDSLAPVSCDKSFCLSC